MQERHRLETTVFKQDGAPLISLNPLKICYIFGADRVISRVFEIACAPPVHRTLILAIFICGDIWKIWFIDNHISVAELKTSITRHVRCVTTAMVEHDVLRFQHVVASSGSHIDHIIG
ncbi:hypothetical protein TNCV_1429871 [Trichonephila clavipes]|nr:hypothetical protein TNCV_1429871 [Trichonephila clavipes]